MHIRSNSLFNNDGPFGTFFRYICDKGTYLARHDDLFDAISEGREPNSSVAQCFTAMNTLDRLEQCLDRAG
jgi:2-hydroxy-4-carboxymuconate semialdehyde hemiacetal dehydrogenase